MYGEEWQVHFHRYTPAIQDTLPQALQLQHKICHSYNFIYWTILASVFKLQDYEMFEFLLGQ